MPIYGYACQECGHTLDALQKMADAPLVDCPECGKPALERQLSAPRFRLKGKGWYETDFKSDNKRNLAGDRDASAGDGKSESTPDGKSDGKTEKADSTPAAKVDSKPDSKGDGKGNTRSDGKTAAKPAKDSGTPAKTSTTSTGDKAGTA